MISTKVGCFRGTQAVPSFSICGYLLELQLWGQGDADCNQGQEVPGRCHISFYCRGMNSCGIDVFHSVFSVCSGRSQKVFRLSVFVIEIME